MTPLPTSGSGMPHEPTRLIDIARHCGVSLTTASMSLSGKGTVSPRTRERVLQAARDMGYQPDLQASALAHRRQRGSGERLCPIAVLQTPEEGYTRFNHWLQHEAHFRRHAREVGLEFDLMDLRPGMRAATLGRTLRARGFMGLILDRMLSEPDWKGFAWENFSVVCAGRFLKPHPFDLVRESEGLKLRRALALVRARGYRRIGIAFFLHPVPLADDDDRLAEALLYQSRIPALERVEPFIEMAPGPGEEPASNDSIRAWYQREQPEAIIAFDSRYAHVISDLGVHFPRDFGFVALHVWEPERQQGRIAGFPTGEGRVAEVALERLAAQIRQNCRGIASSPTEHIITSPWVEGASLRPPQG